MSIELQFLHQEIDKRSEIMQKLKAQSLPLRWPDFHLKIAQRRSKNESEKQNKNPCNIKRKPAKSDLRLLVPALQLRHVMCWPLLTHWSIELRVAKYF